MTTNERQSDYRSDSLLGRTIYDDTVAHGGVTLDRTLAPVSSGGWAVGGNGRVVILPLGDHVWRGIIAAIYAAIERGCQYVGTWIDDGSIYIDGVDIVTDQDDAIALGAARGEEAIYNLGTHETVWL